MSARAHLVSHDLNIDVRSVLSISVAHDIAANCVNYGVDVTLFQRSSTYVMTTKEAMPVYMKRQSSISRMVT